MEEQTRRGRETKAGNRVGGSESVGLVITCPFLTSPLDSLATLVCRVVAMRDWMVCDVKIALASQTGTPRERQRLCYGSADVSDPELLSTLPAGSVLDLTMVDIPEEQCDYEHVAKAVLQNWRSLQRASTALRSDYAIALAALRQSRMAWELAGPGLHTDEDFVLAAVAHDGLALAGAAERLQDNYDVVLTAVRQNWKALQFASPGLCEDADIILAGIVQHEDARQYACSELWADRNFVSAAVRLRGSLIRFAASDLQSDKALFMEALEQDGMALQYASQHFRAERDVVLCACRQNGQALQYAEEELRKDKNVARSLQGNLEARRFLAFDSDVRVNLEKDDWAEHFSFEAFRQLGGFGAFVRNGRMN